MKCPSFRFYASDFLGSPTVLLMDASEVGAYMLLLCMAWENDRHGYLPDDDDKLRRWARMSREQWDVSRELVLGKFPVTEEGWRANQRMVLEAEKQRLYSEAQSRKGAKGGRGNKKPVESSSFEDESSSFKNESPVKPAFAVAFAVASKNLNTLSLPSEAHPKGARLNRKGKRHSVTKKPYDPRFLRAYEAYPKHEEKSQSEIEYLAALESLQQGTRDKPPMSEDEACEYIEGAAIAYAKQMRGAGRETDKIKSMNRWFTHGTYLDYAAKPKVVFVEVPDEQWLGGERLA